MATTVKGIPASSGIAIAQAFILENPHFAVEEKSIEDTENEISRLLVAIDQAKVDLESIKDQTEQKLGKDKAEIFAAHLLVLQDPDLIQQIKDKISSEDKNAEYALQSVAEFFIDMFEQMDNEYMKERAADIKDVTKRVLAHLLGIKLRSTSSITEEVILVAEDLTPSDTAQLNKQMVLGFTTDIGGRTSHSAIMARSMEIPAVVGTKNITTLVEDGSILIIDGLEGKIIIDPSQEELTSYKEKQEAFQKQKEEWAKLRHTKTLTTDGVHVELAANIGTPEDVRGAIENGAEGIGLFRTEFLYMGRDSFPSETEQVDAYTKVLKAMENKPVVIRTLDVGGDKELPYLNLPQEMNPFLGFRAIRLCLEQEEMFRTQLRALLRASVHGQLKIMFPMIATIEEYRKAKDLFLQEKDALLKEGIAVSESIEVGIMVEIPSTAIIADQFAKEVDFFSIGTNDLIQYTMAADRMNEKVGYLYEPCHPSILRLIKMVIDAAHAEEKWVGMCGEMAGDQTAIPILLGLGLDEFSMSASSILPARSQINSLSKKDMASLQHQFLSCTTAEEVKNTLKRS